MTKLETLQLKLTATRVRMGVIEATHGAGCGHPGGSLSAADVLTYLYFREMRIDPEQPQDPNRDPFFLGHVFLVLVIIVDRDAGHGIRTDVLKHSRGEVAFPGGGTSPDENHAWHTLSFLGIKKGPKTSPLKP